MIYSLYSFLGHYRFIDGYLNFIALSMDMGTGNVWIVSWNVGRVPGSLGHSVMIPWCCVKSPYTDSLWNGFYNGKCNSCVCSVNISLHWGSGTWPLSFIMNDEWWVIIIYITAILGSQENKIFDLFFEEYRMWWPACLVVITEPPCRKISPPIASCIHIYEQRFVS